MQARLVRDQALESKIRKECQDYLADSLSCSVMSVLASLSIDNIIPSNAQTIYMCVMLYML